MNDDDGNYSRFEEPKAVNTDEEVAVRVDFEQVTVLCVEPQTSVSHNTHSPHCSVHSSSNNNKQAK